jgi:hypothetical protein
MMRKFVVFAVAAVLATTAFADYGWYDTSISIGDYAGRFDDWSDDGRPVWECCVADLDPTDADDDLVANIEIVDGEPEISILRGESPDRVYETQGALSPGGPWGARTEK